MATNKTNRKSLELNTAIIGGTATERTHRETVWVLADGASRRNNLFTYGCHKYDYLAEHREIPENFGAWELGQ